MWATVLSTLAIFGLCHSNHIEPRQSSNWTIGQTVQTSSGSVNGHPAPNATEVSEYLGIPFAAPPVGSRRFAPPAKYSGNSTINGATFGYSCITSTSTGVNASTAAKLNITAAGVNILDSILEVSDNFSEDCLTLNIWTKPQTGDAKKAVLVWFYGGAYTRGSSSIYLYNGQFLADQEDVIIVTFNYRVGIFGFPGVPNAPNNLAFLDQRAAVEWVRDNIAGFGGDTSRITLFGQSVGAQGIDFYTYAWASDPIASSYILESGAAIGVNLQTETAANVAFYTVATRIGCGNVTKSTSQAVLSCMLAQNASTISQASSEGGLSGGGFSPTIDNTVVFADYINRSAAGNFSTLPLLIGNNDFEGGFFQAFLGVTAGIIAPTSSWVEMGLNGFACPATARANISVANHVPTWRYRWFGIFSNTLLQTIPWSGAYHNSEIPIIFDTAASGLGIPASTPQETAIGKYIRGAWATFAKNPINGLNTYVGGNGTGWPQFNPFEDTLIRLAYANSTGSNLAPALMYDNPCNTAFGVAASQLSSEHHPPPS